MIHVAGPDKVAGRNFITACTLFLGGYLSLCMYDLRPTLNAHTLTYRGKPR